MKKTIALILLTMALCTTSYAQYQIWTDVSHLAASAQKQEQKDWKKMVNKEIRQVNRPSIMGDSMYGLKTPHYEQSPVKPEHRVVVEERMDTFKQLVKENRLNLDIRNFKVVVPIPSDLYLLEDTEVIRLIYLFLGDEERAGTIKSAKKIQDGVVEVRFQPRDSNDILIFVFSCREKKIYFFLNEY